MLFSTFHSTLIEVAVVDPIITLEVPDVATRFPGVLFPVGFRTRTN